jgi:hypothetical protein
MLFLLSFYVLIPKGFYPSYPAISTVSINDNNHQHVFVACSIFANRTILLIALYILGFLLLFILLRPTGLSNMLDSGDHGASYGVSVREFCIGNRYKELLSTTPL